MRLIALLDRDHGFMHLNLVVAELFFQKRCDNVANEIYHRDPLSNPLSQKTICKAFLAAPYAKAMLCKSIAFAKIELFSKKFRGGHYILSEYLVDVEVK